MMYKKKIRLRPLEIEDIHKTVLWKNDPEIRDNGQGYRLPVTHTMEERWIKDIISDESVLRAVFAIEDLKEKKIIGYTQLQRIDWISRYCYLGITIGDKKYHKQGFALEAMTLIIQYAFEKLNLRKIVLEVTTYNDRAIKLYENFGFEIEGILKEHVYINNEFHNLLIMSLTKEKFFK